MPLDEARIICLFLECYHTRHAAFSGYDAIFVKLGANLIIEETSLDLVRGSTIDVVEEIISSSFPVVNNLGSVKLWLRRVIRAEDVIDLITGAKLRCCRCKAPVPCDGVG